MRTHSRRSRRSRVLRARCWLCRSIAATVRIFWCLRLSKLSSACQALRSRSRRREGDPADRRKPATGTGDARPAPASTIRHARHRLAANGEEAEPIGAESVQGKGKELTAAGTYRCFNAPPCAMGAVPYRMGFVVLRGPHIVTSLGQKAMKRWHMMRVALVCVWLAAIACSAAAQSGANPFAAPTIGPSQGADILRHRGPTGNPCLAVSGSARRHVANSRVYDHVITVTNSCAIRINIQVCYYKSQDCVPMEIPGGERKEAILGTLPSVTEFRFEFREKF